MSLSRVYSRALLGIDAPLVTVETHISAGLPALALVGLPETAVRESKERVRSAIINSNLEFPTRRLTVNLAPADLPKVGGRYDLAIALSILQASGQLPADCLEGYELLGELGLNGELRGVRGALPAALSTANSGRTLVVPSANATEVGGVKQCASVWAGTLLDVVAMLAGKHKLPVCQAATTGVDEVSGPPAKYYPAIKGQLRAKRALLLAAAGRHNLLLQGPPGTGKTLLANALAEILPAPTEEEALQLAAIQSVCRLPVIRPLPGLASVRSPHHTTTPVAMAGGGSHAAPGEVSLAHQGLLFLDELPEFSSRTLQVLREPLESGSITISRSSYRVSYPARFQLVAAMNPCPCGFYGDPSGRCHCSKEKVLAYLQKISGPLLDRIDLVVEVPRLGLDELVTGIEAGPTLAEVKGQVKVCRELQLQRQSKLNAMLGPLEIDKYCCLDQAGRELIRSATERYYLSARGLHRVLKLARTIADLEAATDLEEVHILEALAYRSGCASTY